MEWKLGIVGKKGVFLISWNTCQTLFLLKLEILSEIDSPCYIHMDKGKHFGCVIVKHCSLGSLCASLGTGASPFQLSQGSWVRKFGCPCVFLFLWDPSVIAKTWFAFLPLHLFCHKYNYLMFFSLRDFISKIFKKSVKEKAIRRKAEKLKCRFRSMCIMNVTKLLMCKHLCM